MKLRALKTIHTGVVEVILPGCVFDMTDEKEIAFLKQHEAVEEVAAVRAEKALADNGENGEETGSEAGENGTDETNGTDGSGENGLDESEESEEDLSGESAESIINIEPLIPEPEIETELGIPGVSADIEKVLIDAGFDSVEKLKGATVEQLVALPKVGYARASKILEWARKA